MQKFYAQSRYVISMLLLLLFFVLIFFLIVKALSSGTRTHHAFGNIKSLHERRIDLWMKFIPLEGKFKAPSSFTSKIINLNGQLTTSPEIQKGLVLYFVSSAKEKKFHVYGIKNQMENQSGRVIIYDFQTLNQKGLLFENGKLKYRLSYKKSVPLIDAYNNVYPAEFTIKTSSSHSQSVSKVLMVSLME
jgi:hypothetical protein